MLAKDIKVGATYSVKLHGAFTEVTVKKVDVKPGWKSSGRTYKERTHYVCTNLKTGREVVIKSAAKFRSEVKGDEKRPDPTPRRVMTVTSTPTGEKHGSMNKTPDTRGILIPEGEQRSDPTSASTANPGGSASPAAETPSNSNGDSCSWESRSEYGFPRFRINGKVYDFRFIPFGIELSYLNTPMEMVAWNITCNKAGVPVSCNCPSDGNGTHMVRCKHVRALKAAIHKAPYPLV